MKRTGHIFEQLVTFPNLLLAFTKARRGKSGRPAIEGFARRLEPELLRLEAELLSGSYRSGDYTEFTVHDPKERLISVAPFRDRVVHHALINVIQPRLERGMDPDSYGCRVGKGTDGALNRAQQLCRRRPFCLKMDVRKFFGSVRHDLLLTQLHRLFKDRRLLALMERIIRHGGSKGRGLPIGNLTSQWFANLFLTPLDRFVRSLPQCKGYTRYMDDSLCLGNSRAVLRAAHDAIGGFLEHHLGLSLKPSATQVHSTRTGVPFLGFRVSSRGMAVRRATWRRFRLHYGKLRWLHRRGRIGEAEFASRVASLFAHLRRADSHGLRRRLLSVEMGDGPQPGASHRVNRGGSWNNDARNCRSAKRNRNEPGNRNNNLGFRPASASSSGSSRASMDSRADRGGDPSVLQADLAE